MADLKISEQAKMLIDNFKEFDCEDFEKWFMGNLTIGSNNVLQYIIEKEKIKPKIAEPNKIILR